ncbi:hypothetical protein [Pyxidicoccus caerfyrddinensis]|uniref:hypothetical protein n=1 Tax=Pyxidicoccus caerfyrddinensis TaxID=2709663 RepID=UPI001F072829|nr:hypothetical protein [Pyxidicoccus caerfyrddinensis]
MPTTPTVVGRSAQCCLRWHAEQLSSWSGQPAQTKRPQRRHVPVDGAPGCSGHTASGAVGEAGWVCMGADSSPLVSEKLLWDAMLAANQPGLHEQAGAGWA